MTIVRTIKEMQAMSDQLRSRGKLIAAVPTMGALHEGHLSLVQIARSKADAVVMTLFVNPLQFGPAEDFTRYPRPVELDIQKAESEGVDILFIPSVEEMYPDSFSTSVEVAGLTDRYEGSLRPGHFKGVTTVVAKLFLAVRPHFAIFGQKDAQQAAVIRRFTEDLNFGIQIMTGPIIREPDGLAMSSRNIYLSAKERKDAAAISGSLRFVASLLKKGERASDMLRGEFRKQLERNGGLRVEYADLVNQETFSPIEGIISGPTVLIIVAVRAGVTRLIDNELVEGLG